MASDASDLATVGRADEEEGACEGLTGGTYSVGILFLVRPSGGVAGILDGRAGSLLSAAVTGCAIVGRMLELLALSSFGSSFFVSSSLSSFLQSSSFVVPS